MCVCVCVCVCVCLSVCLSVCLNSGKESNNKRKIEKQSNRNLKNMNAYLLIKRYASFLCIYTFLPCYVFH